MNLIGDWLFYRPGLEIAYSNSEIGLEVKFCTTLKNRKPQMPSSVSQHALAARRSRVKKGFCVSVHIAILTTIYFRCVLTLEERAGLYMSIDVYSSMVQCARFHGTRCVLVLGPSSLWTWQTLTPWPLPSSWPAAPPPPGYPWGWACPCQSWSASRRRCPTSWRPGLVWSLVVEIMFRSWTRSNKLPCRMKKQLAVV